LKFAVIQFPGSNCDQDCIAAINGLDGLHAKYVWHKETSLDDFDAIVLPGGFAYGDYLRCGAIARFSPIMRAVISDARAGKLVLGTCNGFQILCEAGLLPGALVRNRSLRFVCDMVTTRVDVDDFPFTRSCPKGTLLRMPVAHGEGCFFADAETLRELNDNRQLTPAAALFPKPIPMVPLKTSPASVIASEISLASCLILIALPMRALAAQMVRRFSGR